MLKYVDPIVNSKVSPTVQSSETMPYRQARFVEGTGEPTIPTQPVDQTLIEENVERLIGMGFNRDLVVNALRRTNDNVEAAALLLLDG